VTQAEALDKMLAGKGTKLDAVVELAVNDGILLSRIETRASETVGGPRADDNADALKKRLKVYHEQTAPLIAYYSKKGALKSVDGMMDIDDVTRQLEAVLGLKGK
jgi:adenylate kinase